VADGCVTAGRDQVGAWDGASLGIASVPGLVIARNRSAAQAGWDWQSIVAQTEGVNYDLRRVPGLAQEARTARIALARPAFLSGESQVIARRRFRRSHGATERGSGEGSGQPTAT
jgi:hypothetical protein